MEAIHRFILLSASFAAFVSFGSAVITYEEFGAVGDGKTDDQSAIVAAHSAANAKGLPVRAGDGRTYYIGGGDAVADIRTDVDFGTAKFVIDDVKPKNPRVPIFRIAPGKRPFNVKGVKELTRRQLSLGVKLPCSCMLIAVNDKVRRYIRYGRNQNKGSPQREAFLADSTGAIDQCAPIVWDFDEVTSLKAYPIDDRTLVVKGGEFTTIANQQESKYAYHARNISVQRSNVRIVGLKHFVKGELDHGGPYSGFVSIVNCANVTVTNCLFTAHKTYSIIGSAGKPVWMGSYDINANTSVNVSFVDCRQTTDILNRHYWGIFGSNYCKNLLYDGCSFSRFDAHMGVANATVRNCRLGHMGISAIGFGTFRVENSTIYGPSFISLRGDYGSTWEGEFIVKNCTFIPSCGRQAVGTLVGGSYSGKHDFGYACHMPRRIVFDGLRIDDSCHPKTYGGPYVFGEFNKDNKDESYVEKYPYHVTEEVVLRNVTTKSGKPLRLSPNKWMFRNVEVKKIAP